MTGPNTHSVTGRIGADPELRYTPNGQAVASFSLVHQVRQLNRQTNQWEDGPATWYRVSVWGNPGENVAASLQKGVEVTVTGSLTLEEWKKDNETRTSLKLRADDVAISLHHQTAQVLDKSAYGNKNGGSNGGGGNASAPSQPPAASTYSDETPF